MNSRLPKREEVKEELTWRLEDIYPNQAAWEKELAEAEKMADGLAGYEGRLAESPEAMYAALKAYDACMLKLERVGGYAHMRHDEDTANALNQALELKFQSAAVRVSERLAFLQPEILAVSGETLERFFAEKPELREYEVTVREIRRLKDHTLSKEMEQLLASAGDMAQTAENGFGMLCNADLTFPSVTDRNGQEVQISNGRFVPLQMSEDRDLRKEVFEKYYTRYSEFRNTWAALYDGQVKQQIFFAKARKYPSAFEAAVGSNHVDPAVCDRLIESVHRGLDKMHRYVALRKRMLGVDELHMYDVYTPMVADFGEEYLSVVREAYENRWIDVVEERGKRGGAYSSGVYGVHPYMLLNYTDTLDDVFTLVHEMGHSMHTWYSQSTPRAT